MESALYAAMISSKPELESVWLSRQKDEASRAACRRIFATKNLFEFLERTNASLAKDCKKLYETYIDYGAHPNVQGTFTFVTQAPDIDPRALVANYLQGDSRESRIAAYQAVQVAELGLHLALIAMPRRTEMCDTKSFLDGFSPHVDLRVFGLE